jgi:uncharacterized membrane protein YjjP (DUF1212 family)
LDAKPLTLSHDERVRLAAGVAATELEGSGEGIFTIAQHVNAVAHAYDLHIGMLVLPDQLVLSAHGEDGPATVILQASPGISRLDRVDAVHRLVEAIRQGLPLREAASRLDDIRTAAPLYPPWLRILGVALFAIGFAPSVVPTTTEVIVSAALGLLMGVLLVGSEGRRLEPLLPFLAGFVLTLLAFLFLESEARYIGPVLLVIPALFVVLPGDYLSAAVGELALGRITAGAARLVWALFILIQLGLGIVLAAEIANQGGKVLTEVPVGRELPFWVIAAAWVPFTVGLAWTFNAPARALPWMIPLVVGTFLVQQGVAAAAGHNELAGTLVAGTALGVVATVLSRAPNRPARLLLLLGGFFVLTVGAVGLRGLTGIAAGDATTAARHMVDFVLFVPAVTLGITLGYLISPRRSHRR